MSPSPLRARTKLAFGIGASAEQAIATTFNTFNFLFYNNVLGLSGTLCGLAVTIALVFDAISDPLVGSISDRWRSRLGRRHPFLYAAPIPMGFFFVCIYAPPESLAGFPLFLWFTASAVLLRTAQTLYLVPHLALGAELSTDYNERSVLMSYNTIIGMIGMAAAFFLGWTFLRNVEGGISSRSAYAVLALWVALFAITMVFASAFFTRDQIPKLSQVPANLPAFSMRGVLSEIWACLHNRNYVVLFLGSLFLSATLGLHSTLTAYVSLFFWELSEGQIRYLPLGAPLGLLAVALVAGRLHTRFEKRDTLIATNLVTILSIGAPVVLRLLGWFPENGSPVLFPLLISFVTVGYISGTLFAISLTSALADVTDEHELETRRRREGVFFASRSFFYKLTSGVGHLLAGVAIDVIGFPVGAEAGEVAPEALFDLGIVAGPITVLPAVISMAFYGAYRIDRRRHWEIRAALERRAGDHIEQLRA